eukprot:TRINITY_DN9682_c0_g1_i1.p2 TRINITY_DN9682_c0_g1~~TRINITY_DN9682_c0_g1_i1.p2  ORF type:complete len:127 (-),score=56.22 TRINITY_DN9682_c0_g1_i1:146-526(-)
MATRGKGVKIAKENAMIGFIGDEDTVSGLILCGAGNVDAKRNANFLVVDSKTKLSTIEDTFRSLTKRDDIGIILINQYIANDIRHLIQEHTAIIPTILEIPSKEHPYEKEKDTVMVKVCRLTGTRD